MWERGTSPARAVAILARGWAPCGATAAGFVVAVIRIAVVRRHPVVIARVAVAVGGGEFVLIAAPLVVALPGHVLDGGGEGRAVACAAGQRGQRPSSR